METNYYSTKVISEFIGSLSYNDNLVLLAKKFALMAHAGTCYQPENIPYITHLYKVVNCLKSVNDGSFNLDFALTIGWLHDVVEDTQFSLNDLSNLFPKHICDGVSALTKNKQLNKADQMSNSIERIIKLPKEVALVKMADRVANLSNPQICWAIEKKQYYLKEASIIMNKLSFASKEMAKVLEQATKNYEFKISQVINKVENKVVLCY